MVDLNPKISEIILKKLKGISSPVKRQKVIIQKKSSHLTICNL